MDSQEKLTILKNIKSLHFDPSKLEPLKQTCLDQRSSLRLKYMLLFRHLYFLRDLVLLTGRKLRFLDI